MDKGNDQSVGMSANSNEKSGSSFAANNSSVDVSANFGARVNPYAFMGMANFRQFGMYGTQAPTTGVNMSKCVLYPPNPNAPFSVRENPQSLLSEFFQRENADLSYNHPSAVLPYSDQLACALTEKLAAEETLHQAAFVLITWLERDECNKQNSKHFYSMIQSINTNVCRSLMGKFKCDDELNKAKLMKKKHNQDIQLQLNEISKVFNATSSQKVWDHFTKPQRKNIQLWKKQIEEMKNAYAEEVSDDGIEDEVQSSDDESGGSSGDSNSDKATVGGEMESEAALQEVIMLLKQKESLQRKLKISETERQRLHTLSEQDKHEHDQQMQELRQTLQREMTRKRIEDEARLEQLRSYELRRNVNNRDLGESSHDRNVVTSSSNISTGLTPTELRLICLISSFLYLHPFGASMDYISSYLQNFDNTVQARDVEALMMKFPDSFKEQTTGIGATLEKTWTFQAFN